MIVIFVPAFARDFRTLEVPDFIDSSKPREIHEFCTAPPNRYSHRALQVQTEISLRKASL
jgi:hypothetical protein